MYAGPTAEPCLQYPLPVMLPIHRIQVALISGEPDNFMLGFISNYLVDFRWGNPDLEWRSALRLGALRDG
jgi:hypothetical protein